MLLYEASIKPNGDLEIQRDASQKGLGAILLQQGKPVAYISRALTETEQRYAQIEKEMLAIVYSLEKLSQYVFERHVKVQTDQTFGICIAKASCQCPEALARYDDEATKI